MHWPLACLWPAVVACGGAHDPPSALGAPPMDHRAWRCGTMHRRAGVLEVMVIMFMSMGEAQSLPMHEACLMVI